MSERETKPRILCVEDEVHLRRDIVEELATAGYDAVGAADGEEALALLERDRPDLILCDISMPRLGGYGLLDAVKRDRRELADIPFIFLTAFDQREHVIKGKRAGADDYLVKPIDYDLMLATVEARLRQVSRIDDRARQELAALRQALADSRSGVDGRTRRVLDILSFGVVLVCGTRIVFANRAAMAIHRDGDGLAIATTLRTGSHLVDKAIRSVLDEACVAAQAGRDHLASLSIPRPSGRRDFLLTVCALPDDADPCDDDARAVVFISDPERRPAMPGQVLSGLFGLTPTEAEVARALAQGRRTDEIAASLGIAPTTVAFHLRNLFDKTGTHRQADLIVLLLTGLASVGEPREDPPAAT